MYSPINESTGNLSLFFNFAYQQMDGDVYKDLRSHFTLLCGTEMETCMATHKQYTKFWKIVTKVFEYLHTVFVHV